MSDPSRRLIVDDDNELRQSMADLLTASGYEVCTAPSSSAGLEKVREFGPDLIILDVMMESTTAGFQFAYKIREAKEDSPYAQYRNIPILMLTGIHEKTKFRFSLPADGAFLPVNEFLTKPASPSQLLETVAKLLHPSRPEE